MGSDAGLVLVRSIAPEGRADAFNAWYEEHAAALAGADRVRSARRYEEIGEDRHYMVSYDLGSLEILDTEGWHEAAVLPLGGVRAVSSDRRVYQRIPSPPVSNDEDDAVCGDAVVCMWWTPAPGDEDDFNAWYDQEHTPMLMGIPGWLRLRRYALVDGRGPNFLALHDLESEAVAQHPKLKDAWANMTPWWIKLRTTRLDSEMTAFHLLSNHV